jgi:cytochrome c oxidase subunit 3
MSHPAVTKNDHYYVPHASHYSLLLSVGIFLLLAGFVLVMNEVSGGPYGMALGAGVMAIAIVQWFKEIITEHVKGSFSGWEDRSFRIGMIWFIFSEVMFFACFFGTLFYVRRISLPELAHFDPAFTPYTGFTGAWPSAGPLGDSFTAMKAWGVPTINTLLLLASGVTITWAHWGLYKNNRFQLNLGLALTVLLGWTFMGFQVQEYMHAYEALGLTLGAGVYGATFFIMTGFHGLHVSLGSIMLLVMLGRGLIGHFSEHNHFAFEAVAWYWHFVDVVWLILFVFVYWL